MLEVSRAKLKTAELSFKIVGKGDIDIIVELALGACIGEWLHIAQRLSKNGHTVLLYERAGCGTSGASSLKRSLVNVCLELKELLNAFAHCKKITVIVHSQGGLYAQQFARMYQELIGMLILLDPLSADDDRFRRELTEKEYKKGGVDKFSNLSLPYTLARLKLGWLIKKLMKNAPPFYYYPDFTADAKDYILTCITRPLCYKTAMEEYELSHKPENVLPLQNADTFPDIPLRLITHCSETQINEIMQFGTATRAEAEKVETLWQTLMAEYLTLSNDSRLIRAKRSAHYIHLTEFELVEQLLQ